MIYRSYKGYEHAHCVSMYYHNIRRNSQPFYWDAMTISIHPEAVEWLITFIGARQVEWLCDGPNVWFRTREQAMLFKLTFA